MQNIIESKGLVLPRASPALCAARDRFILDYQCGGGRAYASIRSSASLQPGRRRISQTTRQKLLEYATQRIGRDAVAKRLRASEQTLQTWLDGQGVMPNSALLKLADLIDEIDKSNA